MGNQLAGESSAGGDPCHLNEDTSLGGEINEKNEAEIAADLSVRTEFQ